jgi:hypothetical protein
LYGPFHFAIDPVLCSKKRHARPITPSLSMDKRKCSASFDASTLALLSYKKAA